MNFSAFILSVLFVPCFSILAAPPNPNILIFMADDMGIGDSSAYLKVSLSKETEPVSKTLKTPNIEKFAKQGMIFTDAHAPASMCSSTRYSLLTGRLAHRSYLKKQGWLPHGPNRSMIQRDLVTLPEMLQQNDYFTGVVGKYHVGMDFDDGHGNPADEFDYKDVDFTKKILDGPTHHGFDEFFGIPGNTEDSLDTEPRVFIRNDSWTFTEREKMKWTGIQHRSGQILSAPDWNLSQIGPSLLKEGIEFIEKASLNTKPFFLYYVPAANHYQRNSNGDYAVPESIDNQPVKGASRYTDGTKGGDREDMVIENDLAFGSLLKKIRETDDPRNPGKKIIDNTLIIFTSDNGPNVGDNLGVNQESGGLRGKKAKLWEGGHRVPFILFWKNKIESNSINRNLFSLTDLYATIAKIIGYNLKPMEAQDSLDSYKYWKDPERTDSRPRYFFCHLGPPYENDAIAIRQGSKKVIVKGGLAQPWTENGSKGSANASVFYDLKKNFYETEDFTKNNPQSETMVNRLLKIHNQGYSRELNLPSDKNLILDDGWHNLRNDISGSIGFEFKINKNQTVTHLGMWDDHDREIPVRNARGIPAEFSSDQPSRTGNKTRSISGDHKIRLWEIKNSDFKEIGAVQINSKTQGELEGEFRYLRLNQPVNLSKELTYGLTMSTSTGDGDQFHDDVAFDGLSPVINPTVTVIKSLMFKNEYPNQILSIPSFADLDSNYSLYRVPVGPTLRFR